MFLLRFDAQRGADPLGSHHGGGGLYDPVKIGGRQIQSVVFDGPEFSLGFQQLLDKLLARHRIVGAETFRASVPGVPGGVFD